MIPPVIPDSLRKCVGFRVETYFTSTDSRIEGWMPQKASKVPGPGKRIVTVSCGSCAPELKSKRGS